MVAFSDVVVGARCSGPEFIRLVGTGIAVEVTHPVPSAGSGAWPPGLFPLMVFEHGNNLVGGNYSELADLLARRGLVFATITSSADDDWLGRAQRIRCAARLMTSDWAESGRLDGRILFGGHSTGGKGAIDAMKSAVDGGDHSGGLVGAVSIAPGGTDGSTGGPPSPLDGPGYPPSLVVQGSKDADVDWQGFQAFDRAAREAPIVDVEQSHGAAAMVYAYGVDHTEYGGSEATDCGPMPRGLALNEAYVATFVDAVLYDDLPAKRRFWGPPTLEVPTELDAVWPPPPPVYGTNRQPHDPSRGYERFIVDDFENGDELLGAAASVEFNGPFSSMVEGGLDIAVHDTGALVVDWTLSPDGTAPSITWNLNADVQSQLSRATAVVLRGTTVSNFSPMDGSCSALVERPLTEFSVTLVDTNGAPTSVNSSDYVDFVQPDEGLGTLCGTANTNCDTKNYLQVGLRIPLADFCGNGVAVQDATNLIMTFQDEGRFAVDSLEFVRSPLDPAVACSCVP